MVPGEKLSGPFAPGRVARGQITHPGYEHVVWQATIKQMEAPRYFAFTWHPYGIDPKVDYTKEAPTLVEFRLEATMGGTRLTLTESGFDSVPAHRRAEAFRMNDGGWAQQMKNIKPMSRVRAHAGLPDPAPIFAALGDGTRLSLLAKLSDGQTESIAKLSSDTKLTRKAITKHLRVLENAGLVSSLRVGRESRFAFRPNPIVEAQSYLDLVSRQWDEALSRLKAFVEG